MAEKKNTKKQKSSVAQAKANPLSRYLRETRGELRKVTWPTRPEAIRLSGIVLAATAVMTAMLFSFDWIFRTLVGLLIDLIV